MAAKRVLVRRGLLDITHGPTAIVAGRFPVDHNGSPAVSDLTRSAAMATTDPSNCPA